MKQNNRAGKKKIREEENHGKQEYQPVNLRLLALEVLLEISERGGQSHLVLKDMLDKNRHLAKTQRAFLTRLVEGTLEYQIRLDYVTDCFAKTPVKKQKPVIREILRMGVYQLLFMKSVPESAVCNEAVKLAEKKGFRNLKGFVNGVLRSVAREADRIKYPDRGKELVKALSVQYSMPEWIVVRWLSEYPTETVEKMLASFLEPQPLWLRCRKQSGMDTVQTAVRAADDRETKESEKDAFGTEDCIAKLEREGAHVQRHPLLSYAVCVTGVDRLETLSAFREGSVTVQDISSMMVGEMAAPKKGNHVIDVCGAPGGKSFHIADLLRGTGNVITRDVSEYKLLLIKENLIRLGIQNLTVQLQDATEFCEKDAEAADIVLADVPCSGLGVLGRKKEIKYRLTKEKQQSLVNLQRQILDTVWQYVKPGGLLIYSTCTVSRKENEENIAWFLKNYPFMEIEHIQLLPGNPTENLPGNILGRLSGKNHKKQQSTDGQKHADIQREISMRQSDSVWMGDGFFIAKLRRDK